MAPSLPPLPQSGYMIPTVKGDAPQNQHHTVSILSNQIKYTVQPGIPFNAIFCVITGYNDIDNTY